MFKALLKAARMKKSCPIPADIVDRIFSGSAPGTGPPFGRAHRFHQKNSSMGVLSSDARSFTKKYNKALHKEKTKKSPNSTIYSSIGTMSFDTGRFVELDLPLRSSSLCEGRLSIICENKVHFQGTVRYAALVSAVRSC